jgi:hypothetical protein
VVDTAVEEAAVVGHQQETALAGEVLGEPGAAGSVVLDGRGRMIGDAVVAK